MSNRNDSQLPTIDVLMCAYNYGRFIGRALDSALQQDYPSALLRVIVVDDGSTDETATVVGAIAERDPRRVHLIRQQNAGLRAAINRALSEVDADLVALLDADDVWLPEKTAAQVQLFQDEPDLGMTFCDMTVVDGEERVVRPSQVGNVGEIPRDAFAGLLVQNVATQSSIIIRRELARPLPEGITYSDWWFALCAAEASGVAYLPVRLALYREHGANLTSGVTGAAAVREYRKEIRFHLWTLRHLAIERLSAQQVASIWQAIEFKAQRAIQANGSALIELVDRNETDAGEASRLRATASRAADEGDLQRSMILLCRAAAWDPLAAGVRLELETALQRLEEAERQPDPLAEARGFVVLAQAEDLLADDTMLALYAEAAAGLSGITLAIDATRLPPDTAAEQLGALISRVGLEDVDEVDILAVIGERGAAQSLRMRRRADVLYAQRGAEPGSGPPTVYPDTLDQLGRLVSS